MTTSSQRFILLLSGGLDSVVNLHVANDEGDVVCALTFDYGQRSVKQELSAAQYFCRKLGIQHEVIEIHWLKNLTHTALVNQKEDLPNLKDLDDVKEGVASAKSVWVPNRNGVFLNIAASYAESMKAQYVVPGFNKEEAATFPDNSQEFIEKLNSAFSLSTMSGVKVKCFTTDLDKVGMIRRAYELGVELEKVWSCYQDREKPCGRCESCQRSLRAIERVGRK